MICGHVAIERGTESDHVRGLGRYTSEEGWPASDELVEDTSSRPNVHPLVILPPQTLSIRITTQTRRNADLELPLVADNQVLEANTLEKSTSWTSPEKHPGMGAHSG